MTDVGHELLCQSMRELLGKPRARRYLWLFRAEAPKVFRESEDIPTFA